MTVVVVTACSSLGRFGAVVVDAVGSTSLDATDGLELGDPAAGGVDALGELGASCGCRGGGSLADGAA